MKKTFLTAFFLMTMTLPNIVLGATKSVTIDWTMPDTTNVNGYRMYYSSNSDMSDKILACETNDPAALTLTCPNVNIAAFPIYFIISALKIDEEIYSIPKFYESSISKVQSFGIINLGENSLPYVNNFDVIIDNEGSAFTFSGSWKTSTYTLGYFGSNYHYAATGDGSSLAVWTFQIDTPGKYEIFARWTSDPNRATMAPYSIYNNGQLIDKVMADQTKNGGLFNSQGAFPLLEGTLTITLDNSNSGFVIADAIRVVAINQ